MDLPAPTVRVPTDGLRSLLLGPTCCFGAYLARERIVPPVDDEYSSLARDVNEYYIYCSSEPFHHPVQTVCCISTPHTM
jgi:hypothetical protein